MALSAVVATPTYCVMVWSWEVADHPWHTQYLPAAYGLFVLLWSALFLQAWKRTGRALSLRWGVHALELESRVRVQYFGRPRASPVRVDLHGNAATEVFYPVCHQVMRTAASYAVVAVSLGFVVSSLAALVVFRGWFDARWGLTTFGVVLGGCVSGLVVMLLNAVNARVAWRLTEFENHRTQASYETSLTVKRFSFQFCNSYCTLYYIAFFKALAHEREWEFLGNDFACLRDNCIEELSTHLLSLLCTQLVVANVRDVAVPAWQSRARAPPEPGQRLLAEADSVPRYVEEARLRRHAPIFDAYDGIVVQFGYITLFALACPLVSLLAAVNNLISMRSDSFKLCQLCQRPALELADGIGSWGAVLQLMVFASVATNCGVVFFTMDAVIEWVPDVLMRVVLFFLTEHAILALGRLLESAVPRTAQDVANERARENYQRMIVRQEENLGMHAVDPAAVELRRDEEWCAAEVRDSAPRSIM